MRYELPDEYDNRTYLEEELDYWIFDPIRRWMSKSWQDKLKSVGEAVLMLAFFWLLCFWAAL